MFKKSLLTILAVTFLNLATAVPARAAQDAAAAKAKVKEAVARLGTGPAARAEVKLKTGAKLSGHVSEAADEHFTVVDSEGGATRVAYADVEKVKAVKAQSARKGVNKDLIVFAGIMGTIFLSAFAAAAYAK